MLINQWFVPIRRSSGRSQRWTGPPKERSDTGCHALCCGLKVITSLKQTQKQDEAYCTYCSYSLSLCVSVCVWGFYLQSKNKSTFSNTHQHVSENVETLRSNTHLPLHINKYTQTQSRSQRSQPKRIIADLRSLSLFKSLPSHLQQQHQTQQKPERAEAETETNAELTVIMKKCRCI